MSKNDVEYRFWNKVDMLSGECWEWRASRNRDGYGLFNIGNRKSTVAHRASYAFSYPNIDITGLVVMHLCDNPPCVRPDHLSHGTKADNSNDRHVKGRTASGLRTHHGGKKHCKNGHAFVEGNIYWRGEYRRCRTCTLASNLRSAMRREARDL